MEIVTSSAACFRHVVFPDTRGRARVVDFTAPGLGRVVPVRDVSRLRRTRRPPPAGAFAPAVPPGERTLAFDERAFVESVLAGTGVDASLYRPESLRRRLPACLRAARAPSLRRARRALEENPSLRPAALSALLIGVTSFFRDSHVFSVLASRVLPQFVRDGQPLRAWSAGCSDGSELYSLAIVLAEFGLLGRCRLLGTDCRADAVGMARTGVYAADALRTVHPDWVRRYFTPAGGTDFRVRADLHDATEWRVESLLRPPPDFDPRAAQHGGPFALILCRNVAIYLEPPAADLLWRRLCSALRPGGVLIVGKAERPVLPELQPLAPCVFRKDGPSA